MLSVTYCMQCCKAVFAVSDHVLAGLVSTINLGKADVYPAYSGKANAAVHIAKQMGADIKDCAFLCDDDNDIDLAKVVGRAYMPTVAAVRPLSFPI